MSDLPENVGRVTLSQLYEIRRVCNQRVSILEWKRQMKQMSVDIGVSEFEMIRLGSLAKGLPIAKHLYKQGVSDE